MTRQYEPFYWLNNDQKRFLEKGYLVNGQTAKERFKFIADTAEKRLGIQGFSEKFYDYFQRGWFSLASPILANYGLDRGLPISCFGSYIGDSVEEIMDTASEVGVMNKVGGGTSGYFGHIRPRGSVIKDNGTSDGTFNFAKLYDTIINVISQGTTRRGQFAGYIDVEHADIDEWLDIQSDENPIQVMYYGVCIGRKWLEEMKAGDQQKRKIWGKIIKRRCETGIPYLFFRDNVNENKPDVYIDKSLQIYHQNLCLTGDHKLHCLIDGKEVSLTLKEVTEQYSNKEIKVLSYNEKTKKKEFKKVVWGAMTKKTNELIEIEYQGKTVRCTPDHKIFTKRGWVEAQHLVETDELLKI